VIEAGAKVLPEGGYHAMPRLYGPGVLLVGDAAGFVDGMRHAGVHLAVKSGMLAAETAYAARVLEDYGEESLALMQRLFEESWAREVLWRLRNYRQRFRHGPWLGVPRAALPAMTGWDPVKRIASYEDHTRRKTLSQYYGHPDVYREPHVPVDGALLVDKADAVRRAGAAHPDQAPFVTIADPDLCVTRCREEYGNPCTRFCPAGVFAMGGGETERLQVRPQGCVHCRACEVADPYLNIAWTPPAAGGGPAYRRM
jgi:electron-transferring-flavoprotein dehydrogenase